MSFLKLDNKGESSMKLPFHHFKFEGDDEWDDEDDWDDDEEWDDEEDGE